MSIHKHTKPGKVSTSTMDQPPAKSEDVSPRPDSVTRSEVVAPSRGGNHASWSEIKDTQTKCQQRRRNFVEPKQEEAASIGSGPTHYMYTVYTFFKTKDRRTG